MLKKPEWPGISIAVGIILILALIIVGSRDDFHLKDYASVIAAFVAVAGAVIAYQAAMAKIEEDRNLRLYLRLRFGLQRLSNHADAKDFIVDPPLNSDGTKAVNPLIEVKRLRLDALHAMEFCIPNELHGGYRQSCREVAAHASNAASVLNTTVKLLSVS